MAAMLSVQTDERISQIAEPEAVRVGLVPSEYNTGDKTCRFSITKTGNAHVRQVLLQAS